MANSQKIGLYLTEDKIVLSEVDSKNQQKIISSPITLSVIPTQDVPLNPDANEEIHLVSTFQKMLRENKIDEPSVSVSVPTKDVFLRSFVVPWMLTSELNSVVFYEAKKYVPFDLKLLEYVYQSIPFKENKQKRLRIVFFAVRKQMVAKYDRIFKQAGCKPVVYEPSLVSLAKWLISKKQLSADQKTAVVYIHDNSGQIIFYEKGIAFFVREFSLSSTETPEEKDGPDTLRASILREIRKSFGYYDRQFSQEKIKEILLLAPQPDLELNKILTEELSVKVRTADSSIVSGGQKIEGMDVLCACGVGVSRVPSKLSAFNFIKAKLKAQPEVSIGKISNIDLTPFYQWDLEELMYGIQAAIVCVLLLIGIFVFSKVQLQNMEKHDAELMKNQGDLASKTVEMLDADTQRNKGTIESYKKILESRTHISSMMVFVTQALPEGVWLDNLDLSNDVNKMSIKMSGYFMASDQGEQFKPVYDFLSALKKDKHFLSMKFNLNGIQKKSMGSKDLLYFSITGSL
ncbi:MAG: pilus assembly protein PilM [Candidatus Omnitrophica bacterium]|nr:pilus assembly protein PilM [Candidatus Omnitrophota bacterium]